MANSFVKWCRAKFMSGYKHINVLPHEEACGRSDTETLVRACEEEFLVTTPSSTPTPQHAHPTRPQDARYVEEVSCDVSVAAAGEDDRQEFSFTLYDFDGHGRVTKDDIAGLVRTIYDAVGSSLSLPPSGSRTIRVKLTVAPDSRRRKEESPAGGGRGGGGEEGGEEEGGKKNRSHHRRRKTRRRSTSLQRHELLQIIQANMEKNNLYYTPLQQRPHHHHDHQHNRRRRRHCGCEHSGSPPDPAEVKARLLEPECPFRHTHYHSHSHHPPPCHQPRHNRSHSHDLSHDSPHVFRYHLLGDKTFQPLPPSNTPDQPPSPPGPQLHHTSNTPQQPHHHHHPRHHHHHHRSRSFDAGDTHRSSPRGRSRTVRGSGQQTTQNADVKPQTPVSSPRADVSKAEVSSPHHKHRHRGADHARAMAQVVAWLDQRSLLDSPNANPSPDTTCKDQLHHIHQHIHHHYHHYSDKQPPPLLI